MSRSLLAAAALAVWFSLPSAESDANWPSFRGRDARGIAEGFAVPTEWNGETGKNIRWKTRIPGLAHSSPIIWEDRIFVTSADTGKDDDELKVGLYGDIEPVEDTSIVSFRVFCLNKRTGEPLWNRLAHRGVPKIKRHPKSSHASSTPATDGKRLVTFFGSEGLFAYDLDGNLLWKKELGTLDSGYFKVPTAQWGFASSPILHDGKVIVQCDVQEDSFVAAFDAQTGDQLWKTPREEVPTWSTPTVHRDSARTQVILNGYRHIGGYDFQTGRELWKLAGGGDIPVPTPIVANGLIYITNAHGGMAPIYAIRADAAGEIAPGAEGQSSGSVAWSDLGRSGAYMQTPLVVGDYLYVCRDNGVLSCYRAATGERLYQQRLGSGGGFSASGVYADGKLFYTSETGDVYVVRAGPEFELLSTNPLGETAMASPAISEGILYFRARRHLFAIGGQP